MQNFHPGHPVTRQTYLMQRCRRQLQQRHLMSEVKWVEPALIPIVNAVSAIKGSPQKKNRNMLGDIVRGMRLSMARDWDHFMATLWGESLRTDALRVWDVALIEILHSHLPCQVWYDMMVARYGRLIADAKQQPQLTDECAKSTGKIWKFTRCSQYKKEFVFFSADTLWKHTDSSA